MAKNETAKAAASLSLFQPGDSVEHSKAERRNLPQTVNHADVPVSQAITGEIIKVIDSPVTTIKGKLLWLRHENGTEFIFPCTGVIRMAFARGVKTDKLAAHLQKEVGKIFIAKRGPDNIGKKNVLAFDVFTADKPKK